MLRRQVLAVAAKMWSTDDEHSAVTVPRTVGFVDLVGYTERTATMTVRELTSVLMDFDRCTSDVVANNGGSLVKTIGDEVLFATEDPVDACRIALELVEVSGSAIPEVRIGMARGEMISVFGDLYGPDVNLAARLVAATDPSTAIVAESVATSATGFRFERLAPLQLKGLAEPITAYRLLPLDESDSGTHELTIPGPGRVTGWPRRPRHRRVRHSVGPSTPGGSSTSIGPVTPEPPARRVAFTPCGGSSGGRADWSQRAPAEVVGSRDGDGHPDGEPRPSSCGRQQGGSRHGCLLDRDGLREGTVHVWMSPHPTTPIVRRTVLTSVAHAQRNSKNGTRPWSIGKLVYDKLRRHSSFGLFLSACLPRESRRHSASSLRG